MRSSSPQQFIPVGMCSAPARALMPIRFSGSVLAPVSSRALTTSAWPAKLAAIRSVMARGEATTSTLALAVMHREKVGP